MKGFSLLEVLLVISAFAILASLSTPIFRNLQIKNDLDIATSEVSQSLRRAQTLSQAVDGDTSWGVKVQSDGITLFKGTSFASRDLNFDETFDVPASISFSGVTELVFSKFSGTPQTTGTTTLSSELDTRSITINSKGGLNY